MKSFLFDIFTHTNLIFGWGEREREREGRGGGARVVGTSSCSRAVASKQLLRYVRERLAALPPSGPPSGSSAATSAMDAGAGWAEWHVDIKQVFALGRRSGSNVSMLSMSATASSVHALALGLLICWKGVPSSPSKAMYSGRSSTFGQVSFVGLPRALKMVSSWSISLLPGRYGTRSMSSAKMHPTDHTSTALP